MFDQPAAEVRTVQALKPSVQSAKEIQAILNDSRFWEQIGPYPILEIRKTEGGYLIKTWNCEVQVEVRYLPGRIGPAPFELIF